MCPLHRAWVQSLVRELRSHMPRGGAKKTRISGTRGAWQAACFHSESGFLQPHVGPKPQGGLVLRKLPLQPGISQASPSLFQMCSRLQMGGPGGGEAGTTSGVGVGAGSSAARNSP